MSLSPGPRAPHMGEHWAVCSAPAGLPALARRRCQKYRITRRASASRSRSTTITLRMTVWWPEGLGNIDQPGEARRSRAAAGTHPSPTCGLDAAAELASGQPQAQVSAYPASGRVPSSSVSRFALTACWPLSGLRGPCFGICAHLSGIFPQLLLVPAPHPQPLAERCSQLSENTGVL